MRPQPFLERPRAWDAPRISQSPAEYADPIQPPPNLHRRDSRLVDRLWWLGGLAMVVLVGLYLWKGRP